MKYYWITMMLLWSLSAFGANYVYQGNGSDPNDWFDDANWSNSGGVTNWPTAADNAMFQSTEGMTVDQAVPTHNQLQVGRGATNTVTLATGCEMTNLNQTIVGILDNGEGHLVVDGGTLITKALRLNVGNTMLSAGSRFELLSGTVHISSSFGGANAGDIDLGLNESATMEISGGVLTVDNNLDFTAGLLKVAGDSALIQVGNTLHLGTDTNSSTQLSFHLDRTGSVSTLFADAFSLEGDTVLEVDASQTLDSTVLDLVLIDLGSDTFSASEFSALSNAMVAVDIPDAELSLSADESQLLFSGRVEGTRILSMSLDGDWLKLELQTNSSPENLYLIGSTNLNTGWRSIAYVVEVT